MAAAAQKQTVWTVEQVAGILRGMAEADVILVLETISQGNRAKRKAGQGPTVFDLEDPMCTARSFSGLLADLLEDTFPFNKGEKIGDDTYRFTLGRKRLDNIAFLACQAQYATENTVKAWNEVIDAERAA